MRRTAFHCVEWSNDKVSVSKKTAFWYGRGKTGAYREGDVGLMRKLRMQPQAGKVLEGKSDVRDAHNLPLPRSATEASRAHDYEEFRETMRAVLRRDALSKLTRKSKVKLVSSFANSFAKGGTGKGLAPSTSNPTATEVDKVTITGLEGPTMQLRAFGDLKALKAPKLLTLALQGEKWSDPTPIQTHLWLLSQSTRDMVALSVPGSGKTAGYLVPAILKALDKHSAPSHSDEPVVEPTVVILVPTVELARQVYALTTRLAHACGVTAGLVAGKAGELGETAGIIIATPFRLKKLLKQGLVTLDKMRMLIIDEADHMVSKYSNDIETFVVQKRRGADLPTGLQTIMVASTWSPESALLSETLLDNPIVVRVGGEEPLSSVGHRLHVMPAEDRGPFIALMFTTDVLPRERNQYIIFATSRKDVESVYDMLNSVLPYGTVGMVHEGMQEYARKLAVDTFTEGQSRVLVSTDILSRGIHFEQVNAVINYDIPGIEVLQQRLGRTGRGSRRGMCHTLVRQDTPKPLLEQLQATLHRSEHSAPIADLLKPDNEKSVFIKKLEMQSRARTTSFDTI